MTTSLILLNYEHTIGDCPVCKIEGIMYIACLPNCMVCIVVRLLAVMQKSITSITSKQI